MTVAKSKPPSVSAHRRKGWQARALKELAAQLEDTYGGYCMYVRLHRLVHGVDPDPDDVPNEPTLEEV